MERTFIQTREFSRRWDSLGLNDKDLRRLENEILIGSNHHPIIVGTGGLRKARFSYENCGKSGSARVCYVDFPFAQTVYLITVYGKNEKDNLTKLERNSIKKSIESLESNLRGTRHD